MPTAINKDARSLGRMRCQVCGYVLDAHDLDKGCPVCHVAADTFVEVEAIESHPPAAPGPARPQ